MARQIPYKVRIHLFSPVHIGCDDVYEPTGFIVDKADRKLVAFDPLDFVRSLSLAERGKFLAICEKGTLESIVELYRFMGTCTARPAGHTVEVCDGFLSSYDRVLTKLNPRNERDIKQELNKFLIARTSYLPLDNAAYIPGSAVKGALRTGWLNHLNKGRRQEARSPRQLEEQLLGGSFERDPFRLVKVSDLLPVGSAETRICFAVNKKKHPSKHEARGPQQILEVIRHDSGAQFEGVVTLHVPESGGGIDKGNAVPVDRSFFVAAASFFLKEMGVDEDILRRIGLPAGIQTAMEKKFGDRFMQEVFPIRIGRHAGAESVTIEGARSIKILGKQGEPPKNGINSTTTWLAGDSPKAENKLHPFGWVALEVLPIDAAHPYPLRTFTDRPEIQGAGFAVPTLAAPTIQTESIVWENATLAWNPGSGVLSVLAEGKKAEVKIGADRVLVSEDVIARLKKGKAVKATVTLEQQGNSFKIIDIQVLS